MLRREVGKGPPRFGMDSRVRKVSKAEAILRTITVNAMKGELRSILTVFKLAEQSGSFQETVQHLVVSWKDPDPC